MTKVIANMNCFTKPLGRRIFHIHIPKTGGTTLNRAFTRSSCFQNGEHSFPQGGEGVVGKVKISTPTWPSHREMGLKDDDITLAIVRNPFDWLKSYYFHKGFGRFRIRSHRGWQGAVDYHGFSSFEEFVFAYCDDETVWHVPSLKKNPWAQIVDKSNNLLVDCALFNERLGESIKLISQYLEMPVHSFRENAGYATEDYRKYYTPDLVDVVCAKFEKILDLTGYEFEQVEPKPPSNTGDQFGLYQKGTEI
jgi:hypothetical protein